MIPAATTDPQDEPFDVLHPDGTPAGYVKPRRLVHRDGDWHAALHIWVGGVGANGAFVIFQRRSMTKDTFPGLLDVAIGGHVRSGETLAETVREAEEEIGLALEPGDLVRIGRRFASGRSGALVDREIQDSFAVRHDGPLAAYRMHPEEVSSLVAIPLVAALRLFAGAIEEVEATERSRDAVEGLVRLAREDFVPVADVYISAALTRLRALLAGQPFEPFELRTERIDPA